MSLVAENHVRYWWCQLCNTLSCKFDIDTYGPRTGKCIVIKWQINLLNDRHQFNIFTLFSELCSFCQCEAVSLVCLIKIWICMRYVYGLCIAFLSRKDDSRAATIPSISDSQTMKKNPFKVIYTIIYFVFPAEQPVCSLLAFLCSFISLLVLNFLNLSKVWRKSF